MVTVSFAHNGAELARLTVAYGETVQMTGDLSWLDWNFAAPSARLDRNIVFADDAEEWARSLPAAYAGSPLTVTVIQDTNPLPAAAALPSDAAATDELAQLASMARQQPGSAPANSGPSLAQAAAASEAAPKKEKKKRESRSLSLDLSGWKDRLNEMDMPFGLPVPVVLVLVAVIIFGGGYMLYSRVLSSPSPPKVSTLSNNALLKNMENNPGPPSGNFGPPVKGLTKTTLSAKQRKSLDANLPVVQSAATVLNSCTDADCALLKMVVVNNTVVALRSALRTEGNKLRKGTCRKALEKTDARWADVNKASIRAAQQITSGDKIVITNVKAPVLTAMKKASALSLSAGC